MSLDLGFGVSARIELTQGDLDPSSSSFIDVSQMIGRGKPPLLEPLYGYVQEGDVLHHPMMREILVEWLDSVDFIKNPSRALAALNFAFHFCTFVVFIIFVDQFASLTNLLFVLLSVCFLGTVYNTVWYHRFCSYAAFLFSSDYYPLLFLWTNPIVFREESYAVPHRIHHGRPDQAGDPYGPHLGWLGSYLAIESTQKLNTDISEREYESLRQSVEHIGFKTHAYLDFKKTASVEDIRYYLLRVLFAQFFWSSIIFILGEQQLLVAWYASVFVITFMIRDFNWRGHGGSFRSKKKPGWDFDSRSRALNQRFYGLLAAEWHDNDNHHRYPMSANSGFLPGQIDLAFQIIKFLALVGIVDSYFDAVDKFKKEVSSATAS